LPDRHPDTAAVHAGRLVVPLNPASSPPLFQASSYEFEDLDEVEDIYAGRRTGSIYGRYGGPNALQFEAAMAELEGAEAAAGSAAGMSAIDAALRTNLRPGDAVVATREIYGGTHTLLENDYREAGIRVVYVDQQDPEAVAAALERERPQVVYVEALTNPLVHVADLPELARATHAAGAILVVDATFATPVLVRPLAHGADLVVHSVGKYLGGHGDVGAGVLAGRAGLVSAARAYLVRRGAGMPHFEAWLALRGLRTLALRMERHSANAAAVAAALAADPRVAAVRHPSLPGHPQHAAAARLYPRGMGGILAFDLPGGRAAVDAFFRRLRTIAIVHSLGEVATTISYPAASSHRMLPAGDRRALGVGDGTVRVSCGIERASDIVADLVQALDALGLAGPGRAGLGERVEA
jgi:cystathionine beta-lyase/cystathionine gamma-synthase